MKAHKADARMNEVQEFKKTKNNKTPAWTDRKNSIRKTFKKFKTVIEIEVL